MDCQNSSPFSASPSKGSLFGSTKNRKGTSHFFKAPKMVPPSPSASYTSTIRGYPEKSPIQLPVAPTEMEASRHQSTPGLKKLKKGHV